MSKRLTKVPVDVDTLMYWETVVRVIERNVKKREFAEFELAYEIIHFAHTLAEDIHQHVLEAES